MDFVKIRGKDIHDCFMQMKMKYGSEAHVYNQRVVIEGGIMGTKLMSKKMYEIEIGIPEQQASKDRVEKKLKDLKELLKQKSSEDSKKKKLTEFNSLSEEKKISSLAVLEKEDEKEFEEIIEEDKPSLPMILSIKDELFKKEKEPVTIFEYTIHMQKLYNRFINESIDEDFLKQVLNKTDKHLSSVDKEKSNKVKEKFEEILEEKISVDSDLFSGAGRGKRKVIFFHGPTGAGKTTAIAKLAAKYFLHQGRIVSIYSTDNQKIAGTEQLKKYSETMDIPFYAVKDKKKFQEQLNRDGAELILIDTAGLSHKSNDFYSKLNQYKEVFSEKDVLETILVLPANLSKSAAKSVIEAFDSLKYNRVLISKIDEAEEFSYFVELLDKYNKVFTYLSVGQEVPFDMIPSTKTLVSKLFMDLNVLKELKQN
jgi:flagellar biosynthesis protein FlhF